MTTKPTTETDAADNGDETETDSKPETTETTKETETDSKGEKDDSNDVTPREKELRRLLRENEKELGKLKKAEDERRKSELSETEKLREELAESGRELTTLRRKAIAGDFGLDADLADRLRGDTEEELREDAERLAALVKPKAPKPKDVGIGAPGGEDAPTDPVAAHRAATAGRGF